MGIIAVAATVQGVVGIGFNVLAVPALLLIDPLLAPVPSLILAVPLTAWQLLRERGTIDRSGVWWIVAGRVPGGLLGLWLLFLLSDTALQVTIALIVLGGMGSIKGAVIGAMLLAVASAFVTVLPLPTAP